MKWYSFRQNNSGGRWHAPAIQVFIQAPSARVANALAEDYGLYFNGCAEGQDCSCCGDRWSPASESYDGTDEPMVYDQPAAEWLKDETYARWAQEAKVAQIAMFYLNGDRSINCGPIIPADAGQEAVRSTVPDGYTHSE